MEKHCLLKQIFVFSGSATFPTLKSIVFVFHNKNVGCRLRTVVVKYQASSDISCLCCRQNKEVIVEKMCLADHLGLFYQL